VSGTLPSEPIPVVLEICGEGKTDVSRQDSDPVPATEGVVPVLVRRLCDEPPTLRVKRVPYMFLQGKKNRWQKVWFFKRNARINGAHGCVFALDSEGDLPGVQAELVQGRDHGYSEFPMAIGVAHTCIEAWLLADDSAIRRGFGLGQRPFVPPQPESLPAPQQDRKQNPKTALAACHPNVRHPNLAEKSAMAEHLDFAVAEDRCPSFAAFATEVRAQLRDRFYPLPPEKTDAEPTEDEPETTPPT
jgi:hypothetical protein